MGSAIALMFTFVFYRVRGVMTFQDFAACIPEGFKAMVSPMLILTLAWTLSGMTGLLGAGYTFAKALRPVIIQTYSYRENRFIGGNEAKEETGIVF